MLDLDAGVNFNEVMPSHLVHEELGGARIPIAHTLGELDCIGPNSTAHFFGEVCRGGNLDDFLVAALHGTVALEEVDGVALRVREKLHFDVTGTLEEALDEDRAVTKRGLGLAYRALERGFEVGLLTHDTHATPPAAHCGLDDDYIYVENRIENRF